MEAVLRRGSALMACGRETVVRRGNLVDLT